MAETMGYKKKKKGGETAKMKIHWRRRWRGTNGGKKLGVE